MVRACATVGPLEGAGPFEGRVLTKYGGLQCSQLGTGLEPELLGEQFTHLTEHLERVGLPAGSRQCQSPQPPEPLAQRIGRREHLELAGYHRVPAEAERRHRPVLERDGLELLEPAPLGLRGGCVFELGVGQTTPQRQDRREVGEQGLERLGRRQVSGDAATELSVSGTDDRLEPVRVQRIVGEQERVAGLLGDQHLRGCARWSVGLECAAQAGDVPLQRGGHGRRRRLAPEQVDDRVREDGSSSVHRERGQQRALLARAEVDRGPVQPGLGGSQDADVHAGNICGADPLCRSSGGHDHQAR